MSNILDDRNIAALDNIVSHDDGDDDAPLVDDLRESLELKRKRKLLFVYTGALYFSFISVGICCSIFNPTLLRLSQIFETNLAAISYIFPLRAIGCTVGTLTNGLLNAYLNRQILLVTFLILKALTTFLVPFWTSLNQLYVNAFFNGFFTAACVVMVNVWLTEMWSKGPKSVTADDENNKKRTIDVGNVSMQALHFFFGCGTILGPLIAEPFLKNPFDGLNDHFIRNNLVLPYTIASVLAIVSALCFYLLYLIFPYKSTKGKKIEIVASNVEQVEERDNRFLMNDRLYHRLIILLCSLFLAVFACSEGTYLQFSASFCSKTALHLDQPQSALMASVLAISFTLFRGLSTLIALVLTPAMMICLDLITIAFGNTLIWIFADQNIWLLGIGFILLGAGFSSIFPSLFPLLEMKGYQVTDWIGSIITFSGGVSQVFAPFVIGLLIDSNAFILVYFAFVSCIASTIIFSLMLALITLHSRYRQNHLQLTRVN